MNGDGQKWVQSACRPSRPMPTCASQYVAVSSCSGSSSVAPLPLRWTASMSSVALHRFGLASSVGLQRSVEPRRRAATAALPSSAPLHRARGWHGHHDGRQRYPLRLSAGAGELHVRLRSGAAGDRHGVRRLAPGAAQQSTVHAGSQLRLLSRRAHANVDSKLPRQVSLRRRARIVYP